MINLMICGVGGKMGKTLLDAAKQDKDIVKIVGFDKFKSQLDIPVFDNYKDAPKDINCIIDFSRPDAIYGLLNYAKANRIPLVIATTGYSDEQQELITQASKDIPIFFSGNMSLGVSVMCELVKLAASKLADFDIEIVETHHNQKVDAPSGTAIMLAQSVNQGLPRPRHLTFGRHSSNQKREKEEIGMHSLRGGTVVGEHTVSFFGGDEVISIKHTAQSKTIFALGAIKAAKFLINQSNGLYSMKDLLSI
ncbi:MAG TPA: 4-hydroxy-tetrahydrodipicolinate reductase [Clostridia bacterium]|jgi:4-hydroxy-tetrahydrodipicolinate reductase